ncbi:fumarylacetoacetate hydrolase family protein [Tropicibacter naphthalenivorans]|uniref:Fumarylacetoacetate (FAA) hydrolase family protein n=1 Tax=Tropicibacter naphthalenivorans TaxID=441103 RepID=A0A0P1G2E0_9RHOB|nr:fumarylacetoacetate hydrolase family protein [Tropicibacter naphthalenivorans]CUH75982.1 Fumarylacetoacetate (FAA) hydrolase family protein [Tropicibacter naphthalenivorans]SMC40843.1 Fumarylacetoacetate (FAA) hydrolase family protein [Tropicibacter naphthalenivorans]
MRPLSNPTPNATLVGRVDRPGVGPCLVTLRGDDIFDITSAQAPTLRDLLELDAPAAYVRAATGTKIGTLSDLGQSLTLLPPPDLQAIKASGVTFAESMVERVIEEQAAGDADRADAIRQKVTSVIGDSLSGIEPGSAKAMEVKRVLQAEGLWSAYLEVGIGPDAEVFTKCQPMASVGYGADVGLHPISTWNNPEPEIVLAINSRGEILGATLGNDVNLRDVEGRSALLLGKAKDNNASCAIGPFLRLFDDSYSMADVETAELTLTVEGLDGFTLNGHSSMTKISRRPADIVAQTIGAHHQYPDGFFLFLGTLFAPIQDRDAPGQGFTHKIGDVVTIAEPKLGALVNTVKLSTDCAPWTFGTAALMRNLAGRGLL